MKLQGKRALVTGSSRGIGAAVARTFAREGASVVVNYRSAEREAREVVDSITRSGGKAILVRADVSRSEDIDAMFSTVEKELGGLDILVNNAGAGDGKVWNARVEEITPAMWQNVFSVDLFGTFFCTQRAIPLMRESGGRVVNIASTPALTGDKDGIVYTTGKGAVLTLTKMLARVLAPKIAVNCMILGAISTGWLSWLSPEDLSQLRAAIPLGRFGSPEEVASVALFLASQESSFITGQGVIVDGGEVMD